MKQFLKYLSLILIFSVVGLLFLTACQTTSPENQTQTLTQFAECLTEHGVIMYGASWCPHCAEQKAMFQDSFSKINYVECTQEQQKCADEQIQYLPTWKFANGDTLVGTQSFSTLALKTGCVYE